MWTKSLKKISKRDVLTAGGKGASLGEMLSMGIFVPPGFVITSQAYKKFFGKKLTQEFMDEILKSFDKLNAQRVAVRSSAIAEDSLSASWAGQLESYLNITRDNVIDSVVSCWKSMRSKRAAIYATKENIPEKKRLVSVIIQKMVDSDSSGVMFTVNPATNNKNEIVIESAFGLCETIVQGKVIPDRFLVRKKDLKIIEKTLNAKEKMLIYRKGKNQMVSVQARNRKKQSVSDQNIKKVALLGIKIENHYGFSQDIEWTIERGKISIIQSRPITTLRTTSKQHTLSEDFSGKILVTGLGASSGLASGKVRIVKKLEEINSVRKGEVLVSETTTPDFLEALGKVIAIITNQGGLTSHAAIVSRELGIPAVVGTKNATKKLKTGDLITVDGFDGTIYDGTLKIKTKTPRKKRMPKLKSTGNDIDDLLMVTSKTIPEATELWPLNPGQLFSYIDMDQSLDLYFKLKSLLSKEKSFSEIAKLFPHPSSLRLFILNSGSTGLKVANKLKINKIGIKEQVQLIQWIINILKAIAPEDPLCLKGSNKLLEQKDTLRLISSTNWTEITDPVRESLKKLMLNLFVLTWSFYWDYFPSAGIEISGPYRVPKTIFGSPARLLVKDWFDLKPIKIWEIANKMPFKSIQLLQIYSTKDIFINFGNRATFVGDPNSLNTFFSLKIDNKTITKCEEIDNLTKSIGKISKLQTSHVNNLSEMDKVRKGAQLAYYSLFDFYNSFGDDWFPEKTVEKTIGILGNKFIEKNKTIKKAYEGKERIKMFDPRNTFLP